MTEREHADHSAFAQSFREMKSEIGANSISDPGVVVVADHDSFGRACSAAGVYEGTAVSRFGQTHSEFEFILF